VEYLLLTAVVISIAYTIINSQRFRDLLGREGRFVRDLRAETEWNYRHGLRGRAAAPMQVRYPPARHPTYWNASRGASHFIAPVEAYPGP
jgi:hypothetical protein